MNKQLDRYFELLVERPEEFVGSEQGKIVKDRALMEELAQESGRPLGVVYESPFHIVVVDLLKTPDERFLFYERVLNTVQGPAVVIVPIYQGRFVLLHQYRHALQGMQYAFPRGFGEPGLSAEENARKELREELGCEAKSVTCLSKVVADSGLCGQEVQVCAVMVDAFETRKDYEGIVETVLLDAEQMHQWIKDVRINDSFTISAFCMWEIVKEG